MNVRDPKDALRVLRECVNIASQTYPGVASDYLVAYRTIEKEIHRRDDNAGSCK